MKTLFLGGLAARVAPRILGKMTEKCDATVLADLTEMQQLIPALAEAEIVVGHIWRKEFPVAPRLKLLQAATAGTDMIDVPALLRGITVCNVFGHETAIAEYVLMTMLALTHRLLETVAEFRAGSWAAHQPAGGLPHGEISGKTIGVVGYGRIGREVAHRAVAFGCTVLAANRSPVADKEQALEIYPLAELDRMLPQCDTVLIAAGLGPETRGLIDARRLALMKPDALLVNIGRAAIRGRGAVRCVTQQTDRRRRPRRVVAALGRGKARPAAVALPVSRIAERHHDAALLGVYRRHGRPALERAGRQP